MPTSSETDVSELLAGLRQGRPQAEGEAFEHIHDELRRLARGQRRRWKGDPSLRTTALAHEAYLKLVGPDDRSWENRSHFLAVAAKAMRHVLINEAERKHAQKRGGAAPTRSLEALREEISREQPADSEQADEKVTEGEVELIVLLDKALGRLGEEHPRAARGVECRFFGGMTIEETAEALGVSASTISRDWAHARAWLYREMEKMRGGDHGAEKQT